MKNVDFKIMFCVIVSIIGGTAAFCLMCYLDEITLETDLQRMFIWLYFFAFFCVIIFGLKSKITYFIKQQTLLLVVGVFLSILWGMSSQKFFLPQQYMENQIEVSILENKNVKSQGQEVWLNAISVDGENQPLDIYAENSVGWTLNGNALVSSYSNKDILQLNLPSGKEVKLVFGRHPWSGMVNIKTNSFNEIIDLYRDVGDEYTMNMKGEVIPYLGFSHVALLLGYISLSLMLFELILYSIAKWIVRLKVK